MLPNLHILDGGHLLLVDAALAFDAYINNITPDDDYIDQLSNKNKSKGNNGNNGNNTDSWYTDDDLQIDNTNNTADTDTNTTIRDEDGIRPFHCRAHTLEACESLESDIMHIDSIVDRDCTHLLRKAGVTLSKCNKE